MCDGERDFESCVRYQFRQQAVRPFDQCYICIIGDSQSASTCPLRDCSWIVAQSSRTVLHNVWQLEFVEVCGIGMQAIEIHVMHTVVALLVLASSPRLHSLQGFVHERRGYLVFEIQQERWRRRYQPRVPCGCTQVTLRQRRLTSSKGPARATTNIEQISAMAVDSRRIGEEYPLSSITSEACGRGEAITRPSIRV